MKRLAFFFSILQIVYSSCPSGFELVSQGECRGKYGNLTAYFDQVYDQGTALCNEIQGTLPSIHNDEQQAYWTHRDETGIKQLPIGLVCNSNTSLWEWSDGSQIDYKPPSYNSLLDADCNINEYIKAWFISADTGYWNWGQGNSVQAPFDLYCTTQLHQPIESADGCERFNDDADDGVCYQIGTVAESWQDAQLICEKLGANLASIHNTNENSFIRRLAVSKGSLNGVFIGVTVFGKDTLGWMDGSDWDYNNFAPGYPNADFGECVALDTSTSSGQWKNVECDAKLPVACIREQKPVVEKNVTCSTQVWEERTLITSPGFPYSASVPCEYKLTVNPALFVDLEILFLEANSCCDFLLVYEGEELIANLTGEIHEKTSIYGSFDGSNEFTVKWSPNGGVNVRGLAMAFRGI